MLSYVIISILLFSFYLRIYYSYKIEKLKGSKLPAFALVLGLIYSVNIFFPILRKARSSREKKLIVKANISTALFWLMLLGQLIVVAIAAW